MKDITVSEAIALLKYIQRLESVKLEAPKVSNWEPKNGDEILVSDDGDDWRRRIFRHFNEYGKPVAQHPEDDRTYSWEMMMPFDKSTIE
jgi:hypothetical protein